LSYSDTFKDHLAHPRNGGELAGANCVAEEANPVCGDRIRLSLMVTGGRVVSAKFLAYGCPHTLVCASVLTEMIKGQSVAEVDHLTRAELVHAVGGLPARKRHAASLALETLRRALSSLPQPQPNDPV